jgi:radical SAM superfamily enzyme YgiQ (UPF0313 family)
MKMIKKGVTLEQVEEAFRVLKTAGLKSAANFMIGHYWDSPLSIRRTLDFADLVDPDYFGIQIATPFPGTEFRELILEQGIELKKDWRNYHTSRVNYTPFILKGYDLALMRKELERSWFYRKPSRLIRLLMGKGNDNSKGKKIEEGDCKIESVHSGNAPG